MPDARLARARASYPATFVYEPPGTPARQAHRWECHVCRGSAFFYGPDDADVKELARLGDAAHAAAMPDCPMSQTAPPMPKMPRRYPCCNGTHGHKLTCDVLDGQRKQAWIN